jgi:hypothetical protein
MSILSGTAIFPRWRRLSRTRLLLNQEDCETCAKQVAFQQCRRSCSEVYPEDPAPSGF